VAVCLISGRMGMGMNKRISHILEPKPLCLLELRPQGKVIILWASLHFLFYVCADNSGHLHHVDCLAFSQICKVG